MVKAIVGANWGDEGKGKITDMLAEESDIIVRFQGGANAGHTIINDYGKFALHLLPSGVFYNHTTSVIGNGVALNIPYLVKELKSLTDRNVPMPKILVSDRAQILMPYHVAFDTYEEARLAGKSFGSTKSGIAPFYSDKYAKIGFQVNELFGDEQELKEKIANVCTLKNVMLEHLYHQPLLNEEEIFNTLMEYKEMVEPYVCDTITLLHKALEDDKKVVVEGAQATLLDIDFGSYPYVTSSNPTIGGILTGTGLSASDIGNVYGVIKAYSSRVGEGPYVTELLDATGDKIRELGHEYGTTTGRPRRCGWLDLVTLKYAKRLNGLTALSVNHLDTIGKFDTIKVCIGYDVNGEVTEDFTTNLKVLNNAKPVYEELKGGWGDEIASCKTFEELPENAQKYISFIEKYIGVPVKFIGTGAEREAMIVRADN